MKYTMPENHVSTRWLSVYDVTVDTLRLLDAYTVFYFGFISKDQPYCLALIAQLTKNLSAAGNEFIRKRHREIKQKIVTKDGKARKQRIETKLFHARKYTRLVLNFYASALPLLKQYVLKFEQKEPQIHKLNDEQFDLFNNFLACFIKPNVLNECTSHRKLTSLNISDTTNILNTKDIFLGVKVDKIIKGSKPTDKSVKDFLAQAIAAYQACASSLQRKMPLNNKLLQYLSSIDPVCQGHPASLKCIPSLVTNVLTETECDLYMLEAHQFHTDAQLPAADAQTRLDVWWTSVFETGRYPALSKCVMALLSCFHGPLVEGSFSCMSNIMDSTSARMGIRTFSSLQTVKYALLAKEKTSIEFFKKDDFLHDKVSGNLVRNMRNAHKCFVLEQEDAKKERERKKEQLKLSKEKITSKRKAKELFLMTAKKARLAHKAAHYK